MSVRKVTIIMLLEKEGSTLLMRRQCLSYWITQMTGTENGYEFLTFPYRAKGAHTAQCKGGSQFKEMMLTGVSFSLDT